MIEARTESDEWWEQGSDDELRLWRRQAAGRAEEAEEQAIEARRLRDLYEETAAAKESEASEADQAAAAILFDAANDVARLDATVGLVDGVHVDRKLGTEQLALGRTLGEAEHGGERVRRHGRAQPLHDVAVMVVMRRLDQEKLKARLPVACWLEHPSALSEADRHRPAPTPSRRVHLCD